jgi:hypothetical protein
MNDKWRSISFNFFKTVQKTLRARKRLCKKTAMSVERAAQQTVRLVAAEVIEQLAGNTPLQNPVKKIMENGWFAPNKKHHVKRLASMRNKKFHSAIAWTREDVKNNRLKRATCASFILEKQKKSKALVALPDVRDLVAQERP